MSDDLKDRILAKRKRRAADKVNKANDVEQDGSEAKDQTSASEATYVVSSLIANSAGQVNQAFQNDENEENTESRTFQTADSANLPAIFINRHRDKSKEIDTKIEDEDPGQVVQELKDVRDRIVDRLKSNMLDQLKKAREDSEDKDKQEQDLKLDLTASSDPNSQSRRMSTATDTGTMSRMKKLQMKLEEKSNYRVMGSARKEATRFDEIQQDNEDKKKLERIREASAKRKFQKIGLDVVERIHMPNQDEQFDFFSKSNWKKEELDDLETIGAKAEEDAVKQEKPKEEKETEADKTVDETKITESTALIMNTDDWGDIYYSKALYTSHDLLKELFNKKFYVPKGTNVPLKRKLKEDAENPRLLELEGYYVGHRPYMTVHNRNLMENRLVNLPDNRGMNWFGVDGQVIALPDPIKFVSTRPSFNLTYLAGLETSYRKALYLDNFANNVLAEQGALNTLNSIKYRIDLDINQLSFSYHNLFSAEHILAFKLKSMFNHFVTSQEQNVIEILTARLKVLKEAEIRFRNEVAAQSSKNAAQRNRYIESTSSVLITNNNMDEAKEFITPADRKKMIAYKNEIKQIRQQRDIAMKMKKGLIEKILSTWKELKELRAKQQFRNTDIKLIIRKKDVNKTKEERQFEKDLREELDEIIAEKKEEYQRELAEYTQKLKAFNFRNTQKAEAKKRQELREKNKDKIETNIAIIAENKEMEENDMRILAQEDLPKPNKPNEVDEDALYESLLNHYNQVRKVPGEPEVFFELVEEGGSISPISQCSPVEQARRNKLAGTKVFVEIYLNNKQVYTTNLCQLQSDFTVKWGQIFNIYMISYPDSILLKIYDYYNTKSNKRLIAEMSLPIPESNCTSANYLLEDYEFSSSRPFYIHSKSSNQTEQVFISGSLKAGAGWSVDEKNGSALVPPVSKSKLESLINHEEMKNYDAIAALGVSQMQDIEKLAKWIMKSNLDPNDPRNSDLINLIRNIIDSDDSGNDFSGFKIPDYFRLDQMIEEFNFSTDEDIENNRRYRLIMLRAKNEPEFRGYRMIPAIERFVRKDQFESYEKRLQKDTFGDDQEEEEKESEKNQIRVSKKKDLLNEIEMSRVRGQKIVKKIRERIIKQYKFTQSQKTLADMIVEEQVPNINALGNLFWSLYVEPRRPLYPTRRERKKVKGQNVSPDEVFILVNIVNAYDLPVRKDKLSNDPMKSIKDPISGRTIKIHEHIAGESLVRPFVEVTFQETVYRTLSADGPNASWNQEINLPFKAPNNDLRPESLQTCKDNIYINVYDEVIVDALEDDRERDTTIHKKIQRYWLGSLKIPFSTIYFKSKIEGTFKLETPPIMLGYTRDPRLSQLQTFSNMETAINMDAPLRESSYLSLYLTIEPQLLVPDAYRESYDSIESLELLEKAVKWGEGIKKKHPTREVRPIVMNTEGKSVLVTRYFRPIKPPEELIENGETSFETALNVARFVSLIPFVSDSLIFPGICDIWSTCDQFLEILSGDEEEHSVLLVNFFLGLGKKAWLLTGSSITNGLSSYVLSIENGDYTIWYQGQPYKVNEPHNPVKVVSALMNAEDIWANVQSFDEPYRIKFDVKNSKHWRPFFGTSSINKFDSIQPERLIFYPTDPKWVRELETKIESRLREKFQEWRPRFLTNFSRYASSALRQILTKMEKESKNLKMQTEKEPDELENVLSTYRMSGFPLNMPYTNINAILEAVYATQVHAVPTSDVEFALGVHIHPYPNTILSVWIYIASLNRKSF